MTVDYAKKFGITKKLLGEWKDEGLFLSPGHQKNKKTEKVLIILIHGWSSVPRQIKPLAKELNKYGYGVDVLKLSGHATRPEDLEKFGLVDWVHDVTSAIKRHKESKKFDKVIVGGVSMGGNIGMLVSLEESVDGIILIGTPVHLKGHFSIRIFSIIKPIISPYIKKNTPKGIFVDKKASYQYIPIKSVREVLRVIKKSVFSLKKIVVPILILQIENDFFVTKYSPWIIYKNVSSQIKEIQWIHTSSENHIPQGVEVKNTAGSIDKFIKKLK